MSDLDVSTKNPADAGWCNACAVRPPYTPNRVTVVRTRTVESRYCPACTGVLLRLLSASQGAVQDDKSGLKPCRSPYCECDVGKCTHPGFYDARGS